MHEKAPRIVYNDNISSSEERLQRDQSVSIHHRNIHLLGIELYKTRNDISGHTINELLKQRSILSRIFDHKQILQHDQLALLAMV